MLPCVDHGPRSCCPACHPSHGQKHGPKEAWKGVGAVGLGRFDVKVNFSRCSRSCPWTGACKPARGHWGSAVGTCRREVLSRERTAVKNCRTKWSTNTLATISRRPRGSRWLRGFCPSRSQITYTTQTVSVALPFRPTGWSRSAFVACQCWRIPAESRGGHRWSRKPRKQRWEPAPLRCVGKRELFLFLGKVAVVVGRGGTLLGAYFPSCPSREERSRTVHKVYSYGTVLESCASGPIYSELVRQHIYQWELISISLIPNIKIKQNCFEDTIGYFVNWTIYTASIWMETISHDCPY